MKCPFRWMRRMRTPHCWTGHWLFFGRKKRDALKKRVQTLFSIRRWKAIWVSSAFNASQAFDIFFFVTDQKRFIRLKKGQKNKALAARQQGFGLPCYHSTRGSYRSHMTVLWKSHGTILEKIRSHRSCMKVTRKSHDATTLFYRSSELSSFWYSSSGSFCFAAASSPTTISSMCCFWYERISQ